MIPSTPATVAPFAGAWIEIANLPEPLDTEYVAPFAGAWIEIENVIQNHFVHIVAPFAGAWIEIKEKQLSELSRIVAPFAGAWIEIDNLIKLWQFYKSLPSRERGLKSVYRLRIMVDIGRSLRGSVD